MLKILFPKNIIQLLPLLGVYIIVVLLFSNNDFFGDESRHYHYAQNITKGFYESSDNPSFRNGPGYPMILAPFIAIGTDLILPKLLNALLLFLALVYFKKTIDLFTKNKLALLFVYMLGLYPPIIRYTPLLYSEPLTYLTFCGMAYHYCKATLVKHYDWKDILIAAAYLGLLVLTKIIYLQVILASLFFLGIISIWKRNNEVKISLLVLGCGFLFITPYLFYAYTLTGKPLYVGTGGGEILYHRSTPFENEFGSWFSREDILNGQNPDYIPSSGVYEDLTELSKNHREFYMSIENMSHIERDSVFKAAAIRNMKEHPVKYLKNTLTNIGRFAFHYPFSYRAQSINTFGFMLPNAVLTFLWILSIYPFFITRKTFPFAIQSLMVFSLIYAGGIILLDARGRHALIMAPTLILFFSYIYMNIIKIKVN
ncbi:hypothetical protein [Zobellia alginiliquefaciens]|uniref:hypothetical protein n=1 Tax=Zobellia alginiliquefaciens TaxID=3032586 RepID=UPI0023E3593B|nr:hypothetical protein [Zobellia alginiliquefaciens]